MKKIGKIKVLAKSSKLNDVEMKNVFGGMASGVGGGAACSPDMGRVGEVVAMCHLMDI